MLETDNFLGFNIESYLHYDGKAFRIAIKLFFIFKISISILVVHRRTKSIKNDQEKLGREARTRKKRERKRLVSAKNYIIGSNYSFRIRGKSIILLAMYIDYFGHFLVEYKQFFLGLLCAAVIFFNSALWCKLSYW